ncbi:multi-sensor hybrid histidine kinase [Chloroherpeton thalassium ATCC 35110]|uniref:Sensory/regulatory protein RpfC n=1 Tax=Chloroherpeton thalassium (strain ATCC 35110 / GB-78) TaxID=517418 RepID=B3QSA0_CHLT3|nr:response regulator [Chloroherpeton thalassium]ACF12491.1 multi-sensor hybrid histidine kinase [Chloroherpeton thalassium ATCC 35110]
MTEKIKVLYIEDDRVDQIAFERLIKQQSHTYDYKVVNSVAAAKAMLVKEDFHVIITDYNLGDGTASDVLEQFHKTPVIFITGTGDEEIAVNAMKSGAYDYLVKDPERNYLKVLPLSIEKAIHHQKSAERLRLLESVVVNGNDAVLIAEHTGKSSGGYPKVIYINRAFTLATGYELEEVIEKPSDVLFGEKTSQRELVKIRKAMKGNESVRTELICYKKDGAVFWNDVNIVPVKDENGIYTHWVSVHRDITHRKKTEEALVKAKILAEESMRSKERFLANMSHEIRTPMNAVIGMTNLLLRTPLSSEQAECVDIIKQSSENLLVIINDILDFSKIESGKITFESIPFSLHSLLKKTISTFSLKASEKDLSLSLSLDASCPDSVMGDSVRLNQILVNLVGNALKFTEKGKIVVKVQLDRRTPTHSVVLFSISDTGIGIDAEKQETIFESFTQAGNDTTRKFGGTGLGLAITKKLVELQGGKIWVKSELGVGATFSFALPLKVAQTEYSTPKLQVQRQAVSDFSKHRILLVEDNYFNQIVAKKTLETFQVSCDVAENGRVALERLAAAKYDLILMDVQMPEMDGYEATRLIRKMPPPLNEIPIIAMTAGALKGDDEKCINAGMNDYISKPFDPERLYELLAAHFQNTSPEQNDMDEQDFLDENSLRGKLQKQGLDLPYLFMVSNGRDDFVVEMIQLFLSQSTEYLETLRLSLESSNWQLLSRTAHKFLSCTGYMSLSKTAELLKQVELYARDETHLDELPELVTEIIDQVHRVRSKLKPIFQSDGQYYKF